MESTLGSKHPSQGLDIMETELPEAKRKKFWTSGTARAALVFCVLTLPTLALFLGGRLPDVVFSTGHKEDDSSPSSKVDYDRLLGGLLIDGFDKRSCRSRYRFALYHKKMARRPSAYLVEKLRKHEALQKKCGPGTDSYKKAAEHLKSGQGSNTTTKAAEHLKSGQGSNTTTDCKYLVSISYRGLGNRMLAIASAFLYAILTDRVLLVDTHMDVSNLFCEPFPDSSWLVPPDFPLKHFRHFDGNTKESLGNMLKNKVIAANQSSVASPPPPFVYVHHDGSYSRYDKLFYCDENQHFLGSVPWLVIRTDLYFVPGLFLIPTYQDELSRLFPEKDAAFHHIGRYLFHPTNVVWHSITRYYHSHLARADQRVGIQVRVFEGDGPYRHILDQILSCIRNEKLLPEISVTREAIAPTTNVNRTKVVLITSLSSWYYEKIRDMYGERLTTNGEIVHVYQPSHDEYQRSDDTWHNIKALEEIYLLSTTDVLITSGFSTFGYVAQSLGGLKPWIMFRPESHVAPDPPCRRAMSIEPCFQNAPSNYECNTKSNANSGKKLPDLRRCEDVSWGLKLVN